MMNAVRRCFDRAGLLRENYVLRREIARQAEGVEGMVGESQPVRELAAVLRRAAGMPSTVLLTGESGVGKEVAARALHRMSLRAAAPFVPVNCGAISAELIESELFGHVKGAFTGAQDSNPGLLFYAQGGTLFLDEISELPQAMQTKLLRVLEDRMIRPVGSTREVPVDIRVIAATNRDLTTEVRAGRFRQDLFYRLDVMRITIPPLRERREDVKLLIAHFMAQLSSRLGVAPIPMDRDTAARMAVYDWPGNIRELRNLVERALILGYFPSDALGSLTPPAAAPGERIALDDVERKHILDVLAACGGNKSEAARQLGVSRKTIERKCSQWGVGG